MAAKTPDSIVIENVGSLTLRVCTFSTSDIDNGDTYTSGLEGVVGYWVQQTDDAGDTQFGIAVTEASGVFTFQTDEANKTGILFILSRD